MKITTSCTISAHKPNDLPWGQDEDAAVCKMFKLMLKVRITLMILSGYDTFYTGMSQGTELMFAEIVAELKKEKIQIKLIAVIPYEDQHRNWSVAYQKRYLNTLKECDRVVTLNNECQINCMKQKDDYLIRHVNRLIAIYDGRSKNSAAYKTITKAKKLGKEIKYFSPTTLRARTIQQQPIFEAK